MAESKRRLAAILSADVAGYSRLMGDDERATLKTLNAFRDVFRQHIAKHEGRVVDTAGDSVLAVFNSVVEAVQCATEVQTELGSRNEELPGDRRMQFRIGVNLGDVLEQDDGTIYGDGVNVAARLESLAEPGAVCLSAMAQQAIRGKIDIGFEDIGEHEVKNIAEPVRAYRVLTDGSVGTVRLSPGAHSGRRFGLIATAAVVVLVVAGVAVWQTTEPPSAPAPGKVAEPDDPILALPKGPGVAALPFVNISGDPEQEYFADGITEDIIIRLSRFQDLRVIARNSTMKYKGRPVDAREVGRDLGVRFVLEGSVRRAADTVRVTAQLIDAGDGAHLWAESYDRPLTVDNLFAIQDELTGAIAGVIGDAAGVILRTLAKESKSKPPRDLAAYDCILLNYQWYLSPQTAEWLEQSIECSEQAVARDPNFAAGWGILAENYADDQALGFGLRDNALELALDAGRRAVAADPANQQAQWGLAYVHFHRRELPEFIEGAEAMLALNPNHPHWVASVGWALAYAGEWERGLALIEKGSRLNPELPDWIYFPVAAYHYRRGAYEESLAVANRIQIQYFWTPMVKAANLAQLGRRDEAEAALAEALMLEPDLRKNARELVGAFYFEPKLFEHFLDGLRKAGLNIPDEPAAAE